MSTKISAFQCTLCVYSTIHNK